LFLDFSQRHHTDITYKNYRNILQKFCRQFGVVEVSELKPFQVNHWVEEVPGWKGMKRHAINVLKRVFSWADQQGLIAVSPIRNLKPPRGKSRDRVLTAEEQTLMLSQVRDDAFRTFLLVLLGTGCRPSEVAGVTAAHVNVNMGVWILPEHKTAKKTGKPRIIYLSPEMLELTRQQMEKHPTGPLFPNTHGQPISRAVWASRFSHMRKKFPNLKGIVCYSLRHTFATNALIKGVGIAQVAELLGHTSTEMVCKHYGHISGNIEYMREMARRATAPATT
jgi:integrase